MTKKILYIDMDNTLVDFSAGLSRVRPAMASRFQGDEDEIPGIFALMPPMAGALEAYDILHREFDTYILSTAPWKNPSAWHDKVEWVHTHLGYDDDTAAWKRLILTHHKNLNRGDFLVDDRPNSGASEFEGEWLQFGQPPYERWETVTSYLLERA